MSSMFMMMSEVAGEEDFFFIPSLLIDKCDPPKMGFQSMFLMASSIAAVDFALVDAWRDVSGLKPNDDRGETCWKRLKDALRMFSIFAQSLAFKTKEMSKVLFPHEVIPSLLSPHCYALLGCFITLWNLPFTTCYGTFGKHPHTGNTTVHLLWTSCPSVLLQSVCSHC